MSREDAWDRLRRILVRAGEADPGPNMPNGNARGTARFTLCGELVWLRVEDGYLRFFSETGGYELDRVPIKKWACQPKYTVAQIKGEAAKGAKYRKDEEERRKTAAARKAIQDRYRPLGRGGELAFPTGAMVVVGAHDRGYDFERKICEVQITLNGVMSPEDAQEMLDLWARLWAGRPKGPDVATAYERLDQE